MAYLPSGPWQKELVHCVLQENSRNVAQERNRCSRWRKGNKSAHFLLILSNHFNDPVQITLNENICFFLHVNDLVN